MINLGRFLSDLGGTSNDLDEQSGMDRVAKLSAAEKYVEDGTYIKLREVSLTYNVPRQTVQGWFGGQVSSLDFGVSGRNLWVMTDYTGYDPEVSQFGNVAIGRSVDVIPFPSARSFYFKVGLGF